MKHWYIEHDRGCTVLKGGSETEALNSMLDSVGRTEIRKIREATEEDIDWFTAMGGKIHEVRG